MLDVVRLYPQYQITKERRQNNVAVEFDRRSGQDRRSGDRVKLDTGLTKDIFEIKNKVVQMEQTSQRGGDKPAFTQNAARAVQNSVKADQFIKSSENIEKTIAPSEIKKSETREASMLGMLSAAMGGAITSSFLGIAGVVIAATVGAYAGVKTFAGTVVKHLRKG